jgi:hypothetical protein
MEHIGVRGSQLQAVESSNIGGWKVAPAWLAGEDAQAVVTGRHEHLIRFAECHAGKHSRLGLAVSSGENRVVADDQLFALGNQHS